MNAGSGAGTAESKERVPVRVLLIGAGNAGLRHGERLSKMDDVYLASIVDPDASLARRVARGLGAASSASSLNIVESEDFDCAYVCVPPYAHGEVEYALIEARIPFYVEKPVALDLPTARSIANALRETPLITSVGYQWRYRKVVARVKELLAGRRVYLVEGEWLGEMPRARWWSDPGLSGGQLVEQATHLIDTARYLIGDPPVVAATKSRLGMGSEVLAVEFGGGVNATFCATPQLWRRFDVRLRVVSEGMVVDLFADRARVHFPSEQVELSDESQDALYTASRAFIDAVREGKGGILCDYQAGVKTLAVSLGTRGGDFH